MASDFWLIAGLGNPGSKYEGTRHNMGFMTADVLAERWSVNFSDHKGLAMLGKGVMNLSGRNVKFFLAKPLTYMNESGNAVASISAYYQIEPDHIVVIHDDMDLDFGRIKVKAGGDGAPIERFERHVRLLDAQGLGFRGQTQRLRVEQFDLPSGAFRTVETVLQVFAHRFKRHARRRQACDGGQRFDVLVRIDSVA